MGEEGDESADELRKKKRPYSDAFSSSTMANSSSLASPDGKSVDAAVLQFQNQKLVQQLETKKNEMHALEAKFQQLKEKQMSYDDFLTTANRHWNQLIDDIILLDLQLGEDLTGLQNLDQADSSRDLIPSCPPEETFLLRLLGSDSDACIDDKEPVRWIEEALHQRCLSTVNLMKHLVENIKAQRAKFGSLVIDFHKQASSEDALIQLQKIDSLLREEALNLQKAIDFLNLKHKQYSDMIQNYHENHLKDQSEMKRLSGELEENMAELEESRRKLVNLRMQKDGVIKVHSPVFNSVNGGSLPDKPNERNVKLKELKSSIEDAKILAVTRLSELQEAKEDVSILSKQLEDLDDALKDDKFVLTSKRYLIQNEQLQNLNAELERYKGIVESLQADRNNVLRKAKELATKAETVDAASNALSTAEARIEELQLDLQRCTVEKNDLEIKVEEATQDTGRKDIKDEIQVMASALSKEMEMMESQLNRYKDAAGEAISLRKEAHALEDLLEKKTRECKSLSESCAQRTLEIKALKLLIEKLESQKKELAIFLDLLLGQECYDNRSISEIKESEHRAHVQAEVLRAALEEHSLELRVKAANESEEACQRRLSTAEAEIADLKVKLDSLERDVLELTEAIRVKDAEADTYIAEIEAIGQAYEDMQVQNQHLSQQLVIRDEYNIKLVSDSVKMKQAHSSLLSEKQSVMKQLKQVNTQLEYFKTKIARGEEQMKTLISQALKASSENRHLTVGMDREKLKLGGAEKELKWLTSVVDSYEKEYKQTQIHISETKAELLSESAERKKLEEELAELKAEADEMSAENQEAAILKLQEEIKECKSILKCSVCFDRPKEVVITKCFHLFCSPCIQRNLEIRHRRCPGCGTPFGQNDVREVNI